MDFVEVIKQACALLQSQGRITYRTLKRQFALDDEALEDLKEELIYSTPQILDDEGRGLIWNEETAPTIDRRRNGGFMGYKSSTFWGTETGSDFRFSLKVDVMRRYQTLGK